MLSWRRSKKFGRRVTWKAKFSPLFEEAWLASDVLPVQEARLKVTGFGDIFYLNNALTALRGKVMRNRKTEEQRGLLTDHLYSSTAEATHQSGKAQ